MQLHETDIIKAPVVSEKSTFQAATRNAYTFEVDKKASKEEDDEKPSEAKKTVEAGKTHGSN